ncbi:hypothetical protein [Halosegnis sp.]|uniref:hypothetical protein n=1 Tax=Halosegnis sp. TaxID=2864959 RepID=UPI0035D4B644
MTRRLTDTERRLLAGGLLVAALAHLLIPDRLLATARRGYRLLGVEFRPTSAATRRVRLVGGGLLAGLLWWRRTA